MNKWPRVPRNPCENCDKPQATQEDMDYANENNTSGEEEVFLCWRVWNAAASCESKRLDPDLRDLIERTARTTVQEVRRRQKRGERVTTDGVAAWVTARILKGA